MFRHAQLKHLGTLWLIGGAILALATWACFALGLNSATAGFVYLAIIVGLSLWDSFLSSAIFSVAAVAALNYFFISPIFTFEVQYASDIPLLGIFALTSFVITGLVRRLQHSTATLRRQAQLLDLTHDTVVARDRNDAITFWNRGAEQLYGWSRAEATGTVSHSLLKTVFPEDRKSIDETLQRSGHWEGELVNTSKNGVQVTVASRWSLQRDADGQRIGTLETNNDITERRRAEEVLRRSQAAYLAEAQKLSLTGSFGWNAATGDVFWSEQSFAVLGYAATVQPSIAAMLDRVHPDDVESVRQAFDRTSTRQGEFDIEFRLSMPGGAIKQVHAVARAMEGELNRAQFVGALMDVTAARQAESRLHQAQAQVAHVARVTSLGALSASIAHEVNQPLAAIVSQGEASLRWLHREEPRLDEVDASIRHVIANGKRASEIVQRIRALIRKTGQQDSPLNLNTLVEEVVPLVRHEAARHRALLRLELAADLPAIRGDPIQLQQVIINLIINAVQAMTAVEDRTRVVVVRSGADGRDHVLLEVEDSGPGIDDTHAGQIFEAFFTTKPDGMGIGLSICRSIVEAHGGQIIAASRVPEPGAILRCILPISGSPLDGFPPGAASSPG
ncbi:MAG TPA: PAS domain-containing protein [Acetobacteraceae bacterium]